MFDLGRNTTTLSKFTGCIDLIDVHQISPKHPKNNDKGKYVRKFWYLKYLSHGVHLHNVSHIFFSYSNLRCRYLLDQSEYRESLTHTCWWMPCEWDCAAILLMQQHPMPKKFNRRTFGHFMPYCQASDTFLTFHSHKWPRQNFSFQYEYNIKQAGDENREECQSWDY